MTMSDMQRLIQKEKDGAIFPYHGVKSGLLGPSYFSPKTLSIAKRAVGSINIKTSHFSGKY